MHFHDLRHTGNTLTAHAGANLRELMARMGHSSTRAAMIYLHSTDERQRAIADALGTLAATELNRRPKRTRRGAENRTGTQRARRRQERLVEAREQKPESRALSWEKLDVELRGLEPLTPCLQSRCSSS